ncbi:MAG: hypothetical protein DDT20_01319 [Firmicutes bacterium]|nr:hypothetical protein [Bacillota bacterium]
MSIRHCTRLVLVLVMLLAASVLQQGEVRQRVLWVLDHTGKYVVPFVVRGPEWKAWLGTQ